MIDAYDNAGTFSPIILMALVYIVARGMTKLKLLHRRNVVAAIKLTTVALATTYALWLDLPQRYTEWQAAGIRLAAGAFVGAACFWFLAIAIGGAVEQDPE